MAVASLHNECMGKRKTGGKDRHKKPGFQLRVHPDIKEQLEKAVAINASSISEEIRIAIRKHLESLNLWPIDRTRRG